MNTVGLAPGTYDVTFDDFASAFPTEAFGEVNGVYDNVPLMLNPLSQSFTISAVPEPSTWGLLLCSTAAFGVCRWRRRATVAAKTTRCD
ncbi:MAG: PEP-CTERM sorting domain-containing protein [Planctomycetaceae bacterium]